ncbi:MAG TPA: DUF4440 domain-containing protein [Candidatus Caldiarchaeum subterraneum]|uniref:DUF4440 domain-containing protein n=1 Tax=Caldiarchaeum subterraneum TaxID=311458 RepID=A0A832ZWS1_CALS0|nr:DUF4440 domain-containing protein [Aigarchaeota archaeon]HIQ30178.1 DUF4440 domain-containing protein [Candidatus Caldarchaeum subterraneum]
MSDEQEVLETILKVFEAGRNGDADGVKMLHSERFTRYSELPPLHLQGRDEALKLKTSLYTELIDFKYQIDDVSIVMLSGDTALATFTLSYEGVYIYSYTFEGRPFSMHVRCTVVLVKEDGGWRILHEHYSRLDEQ